MQGSQPLTFNADIHSEDAVRMRESDAYLVERGYCISSIFPFFSLIFNFNCEFKMDLIRIIDEQIIFFLLLSQTKTFVKTEFLDKKSNTKIPPSHCSNPSGHYLLSSSSQNSRRSSGCNPAAQQNLLAWCSTAIITASPFLNSPKPLGRVRQSNLSVMNTTLPSSIFTGTNTHALLVSSYRCLRCFSSTSSFFWNSQKLSLSCEVPVWIFSSGGVSCQEDLKMGSFYGDDDGVTEWKQGVEFDYGLCFELGSGQGIDEVIGVGYGSGQLLGCYRPKLIQFVRDYNQNQYTVNSCYIKHILIAFCKLNFIQSWLSSKSNFINCVHRFLCMVSCSQSLFLSSNMVY